MSNKRAEFSRAVVCGAAVALGKVVRNKGRLLKAWRADDGIARTDGNENLFRQRTVGRYFCMDRVNGIIMFGVVWGFSKIGEF